MHGGKTATSTPSPPHAFPPRRPCRRTESPPPSPVRRRTCRRPRRPTPAVRPTAAPSSWEGVRALLKRAAAAAARSQHRRPWPTPAAGRPLFGGGEGVVGSGRQKETDTSGRQQAQEKRGERAPAATTRQQIQTIQLAARQAWRARKRASGRAQDRQQRPPTHQPPQDGEADGRQRVPGGGGGGGSPAAATDTPDLRRVAAWGRGGCARQAYPQTPGSVATWSAACPCQSASQSPAADGRTVRKRKGGS